MPQNFKKIAIVSKTPPLGDCILFYYMVSDLRARLPNAEIHWVIIHNKHSNISSLKRIQNIFDPHDIKIKIYPFTNKNPINRIKHYFSQMFIPKTHYDVVITLLATSLASSLLTRYLLFKAPLFLVFEKQKILSMIMGLYKNKIHRLKDKIFKNYSPKIPRSNFSPRHIIDRYNIIINRLIDTPRPTTYSRLIDLSPYRPLARKILPPSKQYIGFAPGASRIEKCWPLENFIALAKEATIQGFQPCFFLGPQETIIRQRILDSVPNVFFPEEHVSDELHHPLMVSTFAENMSCAYTNDSGTSHLFGLAKKPLTVFFNSISPSRWKPYNHPCLTIYQSQQYTRNRKMSDIPLDTVIKTMKKQLEILKTP